MTKNEIIAAYIAAVDAEKAAKKQAETMRALILDLLGDAASLETDLYTVAVKATESLRLDTKALYHDFPDIKRDYGKTTVSRSVVVAARSVPVQKTA